MLKRLEEDFPQPRCQKKKLLPSLSIRTSKHLAVVPPSVSHHIPPFPPFRDWDILNLRFSNEVGRLRIEKRRKLAGPDRSKPTDSSIIYVKVLCGQISNTFRPFFPSFPLTPLSLLPACSVGALLEHPRVQQNSNLQCRGRQNLRAAPLCCWWGQRAAFCPADTLYDRSCKLFKPGQVYSRWSHV